jgi:hypothetical protein
MRQNPDGFASSRVGLRRGAAPIPVYRWDFIEEEFPPAALVFGEATDGGLAAN